MYSPERLEAYRDRLYQRIATARFRLTLLQRFPTGRQREEETGVLKDCEEVLRIIGAVEDPNRMMDQQHVLETLQDIVQRRGRSPATTQEPDGQKDTQPEALSWLQNRFFTP